MRVLSAGHNLRSKLEAYLSQTLRSDQIDNFKDNMATTTETTLSTAITGEHLEQATHKEPLKPSGALDSIEHFDVTPTIGREFPGASLKEWLEAPNSDELLKELAITSKPIPSNRPY